MTASVERITIRELAVAWPAKLANQSFEHPAVFVIAGTPRLQHIAALVFRGGLSDNKVQATPYHLCSDAAGQRPLPRDSIAWDGANELALNSSVGFITLCDDCTGARRRAMVAAAIKREVRRLSTGSLRIAPRLVFFANEQYFPDWLTTEIDIPTVFLDDEGTSESLKEVDRALDNLTDDGLFDNINISEEDKERLLERLKQRSGQVNGAIDGAVADLGRRLSRTPPGQAAAALADLQDATEQAIAQLPTAAEIPYKDNFKVLRAKHRESFKLRNPREVHKLTDEDYTPVDFFREIWGSYAKTGLITSGYLERVDPPLYFALLNYVRGAQAGRPGRDKELSLAKLGIKTERYVIGRLLRRTEDSENPKRYRRAS